MHGFVLALALINSRDLATWKEGLFESLILKIINIIN